MEVKKTEGEKKGEERCSVVKGWGGKRNNFVRMKLKNKNKKHTVWRYSRKKEGTSTR